MMPPAPRASVGTAARRRSRHAATAVVGAVVVAVVLAAPARWIASGKPVSDDLPCEAVTTHEARPAVVPIDSELTVTTTLRTRCRADSRRLHIVLALDAGGHMREPGRDWLAVLRADLEDAVRGLDLAQARHVRIGLVSFSEGLAQIETYLTADAGDLVIGLHNVAAGSGSLPLGGLGDGMRTARNLLQGGRDELHGGPVREVIVLASRGFLPAECEGLRTATREVRAGGVLLVTACGGGDCDRRCLAEAATAPEFGFASRGWGYLELVLSEIVDSSGSFHPLEEVTIVDELSDRLVYRGGGDPTGGVGNLLTWTFRPWPQSGVTRTYRARAVDVGRFPVSQQAYAVLRYDPTLWGGATRTVAFANPEIDVLPEPSARSPTPSATPAPSATPTPSGTSTPTVSPSPVAAGTSVATASATAPSTPGATATTLPTARARAFLPVVVAAACVGRPGRIDLVLLVDVSGSMQAADVAPWPSRWHAARDLAVALVGALAPGDRVAIIPFAGQAAVTAGLGDGRARALAALESLPRWDGSRIDLALELARETLADVGADGAGVVKAAVVLTDGDLNQTEEIALAAAAGAARGAGVALVAVGVGRDADPDVLTLVTGDRGRVLLARERARGDVVAAVLGSLRCGS